MTLPQTIADFTDVMLTRLPLDTRARADHTVRNTLHWALSRLVFCVLQEMGSALPGRARTLDVEERGDLVVVCPARAGGDARLNIAHLVLSCALRTPEVPHDGLNEHTRAMLEHGDDDHHRALALLRWTDVARWHVMALAAMDEAPMPEDPHAAQDELARRLAARGVSGVQLHLDGASPRVYDAPDPHPRDPN